MAEYYMFNKPVGCISARCDARHKTVMDYFPEEKRNIIFPVGRLDKDTEGFLIVTDDGALCHKLMSPESHIAKTYFFYAICKDGHVFSGEDIKAVESGVRIYKNKDTVTAPSNVNIVGTGVLGDIKGLLCGKDVKLSERRGNMQTVSGFVTVTEGKKHQVRRMIGYLGARVVYLKRVSIGGVELDGSLVPGEYRKLTECELNILGV